MSWRSGFGTVGSNLGLPDAGLASYRDMVERVRSLEHLRHLERKASVSKAGDEKLTVECQLYRYDMHDMNLNIYIYIHIYEPYVSYMIYEICCAKLEGSQPYQCPFFCNTKSDLYTSHDYSWLVASRREVQIWETCLHQRDWPDQYVSNDQLNHQLVLLNCLTAWYNSWD